MFEFYRNQRGAVTVFVTLLLIPAVLVTGTAVDLSRVYTTKTIVSNATELSANAVLTQYDALLQDLYGLYGIYSQDEELTEMIDKYIEITVLNENPTYDLESFNAFYGNENFSSDITYIANKNLNNADVLQRQIEEYAKYRVPALVMEDLFNLIDSFKDVFKDSEIIKDKTEIESGIEELETIYNKIYNKINEINKFDEIEGTIFNDVNGVLVDIRVQFDNLIETYKEIQNTDFGDTNELEDLNTKYSDILKNIESLSKGGKVNTDWIEAYYDYENDGEWVSGWWLDNYTVRSENSLNGVGKNKTEELKKYLESFDDLLELAELAEKQKGTLKTKIDELEQKIRDGECSAAFGESLKETGQIEAYREVITYDVVAMAKVFENENRNYIETLITSLENPVFADLDNENKYSAQKMADLTTLTNASVRLVLSGGGIPDGYFNRFENINYKYKNQNNFVKFQDNRFDSTKNANFYKVLQESFSQVEESKKNKDAIDDAIDSTKQGILGDYKNFYVSDKDIAGAEYFSNETETNKNDAEDDVGGLLDTKTVGDSLDDNLIKKIADLGDFATEKLLLSGYSTAMFSNYTTGEGEKSLSNIPLGTEVNYFYQSEVEYILNGNKDSASTNVNSVLTMIYTIRFVTNFVSTFLISEVNAEINSIASTAGFFAIIVNGALRIIYAGAESVNDMNNLLKEEGDEDKKAVPLIKYDKEQWTFSIAGLLSELVDDAINNNSNSNDNVILKMEYYDYLKIFILFKSQEEVLERTSDLISYNITNYIGKCGSNEDKIKNAKMYTLDKYKTDFCISAEFDMRMIFLSMPLAQRGVNSVIPPKTFTIVEETYRGY